VDACSASVLLGRGAWEKGRSVPTVLTVCTVPFSGSCCGRDNGQATQNLRPLSAAATQRRKCGESGRYSMYLRGGTIMEMKLTGPFTPFCCAVRYSLPLFPVSGKKIDNLRGRTSNMLPQKLSWITLFNYTKLDVFTVTQIFNCSFYLHSNFHIHTNFLSDTIVPCNRRFKGSILTSTLESRPKKNPTPEKYARKRDVLLTHP